MNCQSTLPDSHDFPQIGPVILPVKEDIIESGSEEPSNHGDHSHIDELLWVFSPTSGLPLGKEGPDQNGRSDEETIPANRNRPYLDCNGSW